MRQERHSVHVHSKKAQEINDLLRGWRRHQNLVGSFTSEGTYHIKDMGVLKSFRLEKSLGITYGDVRAWTGQMICIDGEEHEVRGVETYAMGDEFLCTNVGVLI